MHSSRETLRYGQCRICLSAGYHQSVIKEYFIKGIREVYSEIFLDCFNIFLSTNSQISDLICSSCVNRLRDAYSFKALVVDTERQLLSLVDGTETTFINVQSSPNNLEENLSSVKMEILDSVKEEPSDFDNSHKTAHDEYKQTTHVFKKADSVYTNASDVPKTDKDSKADAVYKKPSDLYTKTDDMYEQNDEVYEMNDGFADGDDDLDDTGFVVDNNIVEELEDLPLDAVKLINRFSDMKLRRLPTRTDLYSICPGYARHLDRLKGKIVTGEMVRQLLEEPNSNSILTPTLKTVCLSEKLALVTNTHTIITFSNVVVFKSKNKSGFPCFYCKNTFENLKKLRDHQENCHKVSEAMKLLTLCGSESLVLYAEISDLRCKICDDSFRNLNEFKTHIVNTHRKKMFPEFGDRVIPFKSPLDNLYSCQVCSTKFETFGSIERHMNVHYNNYVCEECGAGFVTQYRLKVHLKGSHEAGKFSCDQCSKVFSSAQKVKNHIDGVHKAHKKHKCPKCPERFNEYFKRQKHMVKAHGVAELQYKCNVCERSFDRRYALSRHMKRDHLEERNFQCEQCPYSCFTNNELRTHMIKHNGERIFECTVCKKSYARKKTLTEHMKIHNNDRRFVCVVCGQAFVQKCSLKGHMKTHHDSAIV